MMMKIVSKVQKNIYIYSKLVEEKLVDITKLDEKVNPDDLVYRQR